MIWGEFSQWYSISRVEMTWLKDMTEGSCSPTAGNTQREEKAVERETSSKAMPPAAFLFLSPHPISIFIYELISDQITDTCRVLIPKHFSKSPLLNTCSLPGTYLVPNYNNLILHFELYLNLLRIHSSALTTQFYAKIKWGNLFPPILCFIFKIPYLFSISWISI